MAVQIQVRRGTAAEWTAANPILADGELALERDTKRWKIGDGLTAWNSLAYAAATYGDYIYSGDHDRAMHDVFGYVHSDDHTKALHDGLGINAATLDGLDSTAFARFETDSRLRATSFESTLALDAFSPTQSPADYPRGRSLFAVSLAAGWPATGFVETSVQLYATSGMMQTIEYRASQYFASSDGLTRWTRGWDDSLGAWTTWRPITDLGWEHIQTIDASGLGSNLGASITFAGINAKYTRFKVVAPEYTTVGTGSGSLYARLNGDGAANYSSKVHYATSSTWSGTTFNGGSVMYVAYAYLYGGSARFNNTEMEIWNNGRQSFMRAKHQCHTAATTYPYSTDCWNNWNSAASIYQIEVFTSHVDTWYDGAKFHLYGMVE